MSETTPREPMDTEAGLEAHGLRLSFSSNPVSLPARTRRSLFRLLVGKATLEALLVAALACVFWYDAFKPSFRGAVERADRTSVEGWVFDASRPDARVEVQLYIDGQFVSSGQADRPRTNLRAAGHAPEEAHGFHFEINVEGAGEHEARVYAVHAGAGGARRTQQLVGSPLRFVVSSP